MYHRIKVELAEDFFGNVIVSPVREDIREAVIEYLKTWNVESDGTGYIQFDIEETLKDHLHVSASKIRVLRKGWTVTILMDPWEFLHFFGWDTHEAITVERRKVTVH